MQDDGGRRQSESITAWLRRGPEKLVAGTNSNSDPCSTVHTAVESGTQPVPLRSLLQPENASRPRHCGGKQNTAAPLNSRCRWRPQLLTFSRILPPSRSCCRNMALVSPLCVRDLWTSIELAVPAPCSKRAASQVFPCENGTAS